MKRYSPILLPLLWILAGCPISVDYPLGDQLKDKADTRLVGVWTVTDTTNSPEIHKMRIRQIDAHTLAATVLVRGSMYTEEVDEFKGWCTELDGQQFVYWQNAADPQAGYYTYNFWFDGKQLVTSDVSLKVGGTDAVTSTEAYRAEVSASMKFPDWRGQQFTYTKD